MAANHLHREIAEALLASGKHVLCEKPLASTVEDAEAMVKAIGTFEAVAIFGVVGGIGVDVGNGHQTDPWRIGTEDRLAVR